MLEKTERAPEGMSGLAKGLAILEAFSARSSLTIADAARASSSTRAAARRCLLTLVELGYVRQDGRQFVPLPRIARLGQIFSRAQQVAQLAGPHLAKARDALNESVSLAILDGADSLFIARAPARHIVSTGVDVGGRLPAYCSATGRVLLASSPDEDVRERLRGMSLVRLTAKTLVAPTKVLDAVRQARQDGYSLCAEELEIGMLSMAVPVHDLETGLVAAVSVSASTGRTSAEELKRSSLPVLRRCSETLAGSLRGDS